MLPALVTWNSLGLVTGGVASSGPRVFRLNPRAHAAFLRRRLAWMIPFMAVVFVGFQLFYWYLQRDRPHAGSLQTTVAISALALVMIIGGMIISSRRAIASYRLQLEPDAFSIELAGMLQQRITRSEVRLVREKAGGLEILRTRGLPLGVARSLEGYQEVKAVLTSWAPACAPNASAVRPVIAGVLNTAAILATFVLAPLSGVARTPQGSLVLAFLAAGTAVWTWWFFRDAPFKFKPLVRGYFLLVGVSVIALNVLRWTVLRP
jgi:hypothetical protein